MMSFWLHVALLFSLIISCHSSNAPVVVFEIGEDGYACIKIPVLLSTQNGSYLAFGEARSGGCNDWQPTTLVYKKSIDNGQTWSSIQILWNPDGMNFDGTIGNAAPVQLSSGRILIPFCVNNIYVMLIYSDDDGETWSNVMNITQSTVPPGASWVGTGPPGSIQLSTGRIVVPSYISFHPGDDGDLAHSYMILSDDNGSTWYYGEIWKDPELHYSSECQAVEPFNNGTIYVNARDTVGFERLVSWSYDGGITFQPSTRQNVTDTISGCEFSTIMDINTRYIYLSGPTHAGLLRRDMQLLVSKDHAKSFDVIDTIYPGYAAYSSLQISSDQRTLVCFYEISNKTNIDFFPTQTLFQVILTL